jgi:hypothetical protein
VSIGLPQHLHLGSSDHPIMPSPATAESNADAPNGTLNGTPNGPAPAPGSESEGTIATRAHYAPPWADVSIIGIAGSSGSGKSTLSHAIVNKLNLPWVVILSIVSTSPKAEPGQEQDDRRVGGVQKQVLMLTR